MFGNQLDLYAEVLRDLENVFSNHPKVNLHSSSTLDLFTNLRQLTDNHAYKNPNSPIVKIYGEDKFINYYKQCLDYFVLEPGPCGLDNPQSPQIKSFFMLHSSLWSISRLHCTTGYWVCSNLAKKNVHESLWRFVSCRDLVAPKCTQKSKIRFLVCFSFGILLRILTRTNVSVENYRSFSGVHILRPFLSCKTRKARIPMEYPKMCALLLLIPIVNEVENKSINTTEHYVEYLLSVIRLSLKAPDFYAPLHKHHLRELLCGLNRLTRFDANKRILLENGILDDIQLILQIAKDLPNSTVGNLLRSPVPNTNSDNLATEAIRLFWQLCFLLETREKLDQYPALKKLCRDFGTNSQSMTCRETVEGLFWTLSKPPTNFESPDFKYTPLSATGNPFGHIIFACNRNNYRQSVDNIMGSLKRRGYSVYWEPEQIEMEKALEGASALILCLSYSFSSSPYCRQQVLSALSYGVALVPILLENDYQPEAWLHFLLATVIYTPFTEKDNFDKSIEALSRALTKYGIVRDVSATTDSIDSGNDYLSEMVAPPSISACPPWRSVAMKGGHPGRGLRIPIFSESSNASTPTPSECPSVSVSASLQFSPFSNTSRFRSWSCSTSQVSSSTLSNLWSNLDEGTHLTPTEDQEFILAHQAPSPSIREWDAERVQRWLEESGLSHYAALLDWLDGPLLWELAWQRIRAYDAFFANLEHFLNMPQHDQVLLFNSLSLLADPA